MSLVVPMSLVNPGIPHPSAFPLLPAQSFLPPASDHVLSCPLPSLIHTPHIGHVQERRLAQDTPTLLPLTHKILQARSFPSWNYFTDVRVPARWTLVQSKPRSLTPLPPSLVPGSAAPAGSSSLDAGVGALLRLPVLHSAQARIDREINLSEVSPTTFISTEIRKQACTLIKLPVGVDVAFDLHVNSMLVRSARLSDMETKVSYLSKSFCSSFPTFP